MTAELHPRSDHDDELPVRLTGPARRVLTQAGYIRLEHFATATETELRRLPGVGPRTLGRIRRALHAHGRALAGN
ncbi:DNA-binding protein [Rhodococcus aetherivorans]|uniref:DNA-binding protein n=1 Tax=Rhodococcus aetherivorans TaxID=191292 RepID=UPI00388D292A